MSRLKDIKELSEKDLIQWLGLHNIKPYRAAQIQEWIYMRQSDQFSDMTNLSKDLRDLLSEHFTIDRLKVKTVQTSTDGSQKYLFELRDLNLIESVLIPEKNHYTLCVSSQVGCAQGCRFCRTAQNGLIRNLTRGEIIAQVRDLIQQVDSAPNESLRLTNIVFMGMGEPLANYRNLVSALQTLTGNNNGLRISFRRITVSTAGIVPKLAALGHDTPVNPAISLNATDNDTRSFLMPINRKYPIEELLEACRTYPLRSHGMMTIEYILIKGINDSQHDANRLSNLLKSVRAKINLIPFNEFEGSEFKRPDESVILKFQKILLDKNFTVIIRQSKGADISAACGQLRAKAVLHKQMFDI
ncbi:MAG: 23S rRNA (adenine(2503)-C(2))-methyltransferase RlmN [Desulfobacterales bacterium]|jgi:23S rRNA (adenine2503-C2)-methyltransferase|nr:23S rRNA (adenine(2503)-C(2))-methyltransferase RlmN [Desulfobacterales bacterium]